jgi:hypothetical protein
LFELSQVKVFAINLRTRQGAGRADALTAIGFDRLGDFPALMLTGFIGSLLSRDGSTSGLVGACLREAGSPG